MKPGTSEELICHVDVLATAATAQKPNVLLVCVDDFKPLLHCYGTPV